MKTDSQLQSDVQAELKWEPSVNATHIGVEVQDGIVTLNGHVGSYTEKWAAEPPRSASQACAPWRLKWMSSSQARTSATMQTLRGLPKAS